MQLRSLQTRLEVCLPLEDFGHNWAKFCKRVSPQRSCCISQLAVCWLHCVWASLVWEGGRNVFLGLSCAAPMAHSTSSISPLGQQYLLSRQGQGEYWQPACPVFGWLSLTWVSFSIIFSSLQRLSIFLLPTLVVGAFCLFTFSAFPLSYWLGGIFYMEYVFVLDHVV